MLTKVNDFNGVLLDNDAQINMMAFVLISSSTLNVYGTVPPVIHLHLHNAALMKLLDKGLNYITYNFMTCEACSPLC